MIVYRYEHSRTRCGPYRREHIRNNPGLQAMEYRHSGDPLRPGPGADFGAFPPDSYVFGFASPDAADRWFRGYENALALGGFRLVTYDVPECHVVRGTYQVAFDPNRAEYLGPYHQTHTERKDTPC